MPTNIEAVYPLSPMQQGMLFHTVQAPDRGFYLQQSSHALEGALDVDAFRSAWRTAIARHAVLRTAFEWTHLNGKTRQIVLRDVELPLVEVDWRDDDPERQRERHASYLEDDRRRGFDLSRPPLVRLLLARSGPESYRFVWTWHHILLDGWSSALLLNEVAALYDAHVRGERLALPAPRSYRDYIAWLQRQSAPAAEAFWKGVVGGFRQPTPLPGAATTALRAADTGERRELGRRLSAEATARLVQFARGQRVTLNSLVQAAWAILLGRYAAEQDVMFGATVSGRPADLPGVETMVGLFINTVPVRVRIDPARPLGDWLAELQRDQLDAAQYAYAPLVDIHAWSDLPPGRGAFDSILVFENYPADAFQRHYTGEADVTRRPARALRGAGVEHVETTHYPLVVLVNDGAELTLRLSYDPGVFGDRAIAQLLEHFARVLASMPSSARVGDLQVLSDDERRDVLRGSGDGDAQPSHELVDAPFARQVSATPNAVAVVDGPTTLSYRELDARINQLARELRTRGVGPEARVGVCLPPGVDRVATLVAIVRAGGAYVPLDPRYPRERLAAIVDDASPALVIVDGAVADRLPPLRVPMVSIENARAAAERRSSDALAPLASPANAVYIIYTSGSTGRPKGVVLTHECLGNLLRWHTRSLPSRAPVLQYASLSFDVSFHEIFSALACGAAIVAAPEDTRTDVRALAETIRRHRIGKVTLPPIVLEQLALEQAFEPDALRSLEHVIATGEALRPSAPVTELFARLSGCRLHNHYGPSETHLATVSTLPAHVSDWPERPPIGTPIANARTYVLGPDLELVPMGGVGELYIGGAALARGYWSRPAWTAERFLPDPYADIPGARMYRSGDLVRRDDAGDLHFLGRADRQLKIRGVRVEPSEIESALLRHDRVRHAVVAPTIGSDGDPQLVAYVVADGDADADRLRAHLRDLLPETMVPPHIVFLDRLPLSPNGKLDTSRLPSPELTHAYRAPARPSVRLIADVWADVLNRSRVGADDNFFELGGHSLRAMQAVVRLRDVFGAGVELQWLFDHPTPERLAGAIDRMHDSASTVDRIAEIWIELRDAPEPEPAVSPVD